VSAKKNQVEKCTHLRGRASSCIVYKFTGVKEVWWFIIKIMCELRAKGGCMAYKWCKKLFETVLAESSGLASAQRVYVFCFAST
jgi:hypothetical protein